MFVNRQQTRIVNDMPPVRESIPSSTLGNLAYSFDELPLTVPCNFSFRNRCEPASFIWSIFRVQQDTTKLAGCSVPFDGGSSGRALREMSLTLSVNETYVPVTASKS
jgi:hypothetical protein